MLRVPRPAPRGNSPRPAMSASLARCTLAPVALLSIAARGTFFQGRFGGVTRTPRLISIVPGAPMAMLRTFSLPRCRSISAAAQSTIACGVPRRGVLVLTLAIRFPSERASATRTCVPPRSMPASTVIRSRGEQLLAAERGQNLDRSSRAVERVEVKARDTRLEQLCALRDAVLNAESAHGLVVRGLLDGRLKPGRDSRA